MKAKLFLMIMFTAMLILPMVSALEWDNVKSYDPGTDTVTIKNSFLGIPTSEIATVKLETPKVNYVMYGKDRKVAEFTINSLAEYANVFKEMEFYNNNNNKEISRTFTYKYKETYEVTEPVYKTVCSGGKNNTEICTIVEDGTRKVIKEKWTELPSYDIKAEKITIGIFTDVQPGDNVEWIPTLFGVKINEWAVWLDSFNTNIIAYYNLNDTGDSVHPEDHNLTSGTPAFTTTGCKIGGCLDNGYMYLESANLNDINLDDSEAWSACWWTEGDGSGSQAVWGADDQTGRTVDTAILGGGYFGGGSSWQWFNEGASIGTSESVSSDGWQFHCLTSNSTGKNRFRNGAFKSTSTTTYNDDGIQSLIIGAYKNDGSLKWTGQIDELGIWNRELTQAEITDLYNGGAGLTYVATSGSPMSITTTLISPANALNTTSTSITFSANATAVNGNVTNMTLYLWNGGLKTNSTTGLKGSFNSSSWVMSGLTDNLYTWNTLSCATNSSSTVCAFNTNRTLRIDTTAPTVNITYPSNNLNLVTFIPSNNLSLNFTAVDSGIGLNTCWYNNGTANLTLTCGTNSSMNFTEGYNTIIYYANDTLNNLASTSSTFFINYIRPLVNYSLTGVELETTTIYFNITATNLSQANATVNYNNTNYVMDIGSYNGTVGAFYKTITLPEVTADTVKQFNISYYANGIQYNTILYNQTVYNIPALNISAGLCAGTPVYWFTLQDEENLSIISGDFEYNFYYGLSNSSMVRTYGKVSGATNFSICTNTTINPNWTIGSGEVHYSSTGYVDRRYYIFDNTVVTSGTNLTLYDLLSTSQTSFKLEVEDTSLNPYSNIYNRLLRWYPDLNEYKIVDMGKTDETGSTVIHVRTEDVDYRIGAYYTNGSLIYLANPIRMVCLASPCTYTLKISPGEIDYTSFLNIVYTFTYNETTGMWNFAYSDTTGKTSTMNLTVYRVTSTSEYPVCSQSISGAVGALSCNTSVYTTGILRGEVYRSASPPVEIVQKVIHLFTSAFKGSSFGLWLSMLLALPVIFLLCLVSPIGALLGGIIALIPALYFGSINIGIVGGLAILAGIVAHFLKRVS